MERTMPRLLQDPGNPRNASKDDLKRLSPACPPVPPRRNSSPDAEERFKEINEAYQVLDDQKRAHDPSVMPAQRMPGGGFSGGIPAWRILEEFFGGLGGSASAGSGADDGGAGRCSDLRQSYARALSRPSSVQIDLDGRASRSVCGGVGPSARSRVPALNAMARASSPGAAGVPASTWSTTDRPRCGRGQVQTPCHECRGVGIVTRARTLTVKVPPAWTTGCNSAGGQKAG